MTFDINEPLPAGVTASPAHPESWEPAARHYRDIEPEPSEGDSPLT